MEIKAVKILKGITFKQYPTYYIVHQFIFVVSVKFKLYIVKSGIIEVALSIRFKCNFVLLSYNHC